MLEVDGHYGSNLYFQSLFILSQRLNLFLTGVSYKGGVVDDITNCWCCISNKISIRFPASEPGLRNICSDERRGLDFEEITHSSLTN